MTIPEYQLTKVTSEDLPEIHRWWKTRSHATFSYEDLPDLGVLAQDPAGQRLSAVWLFYTNSKFAIIDWGVTNPDAPLRLRTKALIASYAWLRQTALSQGFKYVFTFSGSRGLTRSLVKSGFVRNPEKQDVLVSCSEGVK